MRLKAALIAAQLLCASAVAPGYRSLARRFGPRPGVARPGHEHLGGGIPSKGRRGAVARLTAMQARRP